MNRKIAEVGRVGTGITEQEYYKAFLEDFANDLITTITAGIRGGTIDLGKTTTPTTPAIPKATGEFDIPQEPEKQHNLGYNESRYSTLNKIFEAIIAEQDNEGTLENAIEEFFEAYVQKFGADWSKYKPQVQSYANKIAQSMKKDQAGLMGKLKGGGHISKATQRLMFELGNIAYTVFRIRPRTPTQPAAQAPAAKPPIKPAVAPKTQAAAKTDAAAMQDAALIARGEAEKALMKLKQLDPNSFASLLKTIS